MPKWFFIKRSKISGRIIIYGEYNCRLDIGVYKGICKKGKSISDMKKHEVDIGNADKKIILTDVDKLFW